MSRRFLILAAALLPATSFGQAWLPDKGVFNAALIYNDVSNLAHWGSTWDEPPQPDGSIDVEARSLAFLGIYGITDRWTVSAALPYVNTRYKGPPSHGGGPGFTVDNGEWHGCLTDLRVGLHIQALERPFALAPFVGYVTPIGDCYTRGHAANGRDLEETLTFLQPSSSVLLLTLDGRPSGIELPASVELAVVETEPGVKGDTVSNVTKPATLETGAVVQVPLFVNVGDRIKVDTREHRYISRA